MGLPHGRNGGNGDNGDNGWGESRIYSNLIRAGFVFETLP